MRWREASCSTTIQVFSGRFRLAMPSSKSPRSLTRCISPSGYMRPGSSERSGRATALDSLSEVCFCNGHIWSGSCDRIIKITPPVVLCRFGGLTHGANGHERIRRCKEIDDAGVRAVFFRNHVWPPLIALRFVIPPSATLVVAYHCDPHVPGGHFGSAAWQLGPAACKEIGCAVHHAY